MYNPEFLNSGQDPQRPAKTSRPPKWKANPSRQGRGDPLRIIHPEPNESNQKEEKEVGGKEDVLAHEVRILPFPKSCSNPSPTDLSARRKHNAVPPRLLNTDPLAQIIGTESVANVIIDDAETCALLDSGATVDLMSSSYVKARNFDVRPITELSDHFVNLKLAAGFWTSASGYVEYNLQIQGISFYDLDRVALVADDDTQFGKEGPLTIGTKMEDTIFEAMKEGEIEMLDNIWKRVKNNWSLTNWGKK